MVDEIRASVARVFERRQQWSIDDPEAGDPPPERLMQGDSAADPKTSGLSMETLAENGFLRS